MANHVEIFEFCIFYVVCFTALMYITGFGLFPPRPIEFTIPAIDLAGHHLYGPVTLSIPWMTFMLVLGTTGILAAILITALSGLSFSVLGTGVSWKFDGKYVATLVVGFVCAAGLGVSMTQMLPNDIPLLVSFFLVWVWVILLVYTIFTFAGGGPGSS